VTELAIPAPQRLVEGVEVKVPPLAEPHWPLTGVIARFAEQLAVEPSFKPAQLQVQGPVPVTSLGVPWLQRLVVGADVKIPPFAEPHCPFTAVESGTKVATTLFAPLILIEIGLTVPEISPPQLPKEKPLEGLAVRITSSPLS